MTSSLKTVFIDTLVKPVGNALIYIVGFIDSMVYAKI